MRKEHESVWECLERILQAETLEQAMVIAKEALKHKPKDRHQRKGSGRK